MSLLNKQGVILVMFDLPMKSKDEQRAYRHFIKCLKDNGYVLFQESVYLKLVRNISYYESEIQKINLAEVNAKNVSVLPLKKKDFQKLKTIKGTPVEMLLLTDNIVNL